MAGIGECKPGGCGGGGVVRSEGGDKGSKSESSVREVRDEGGRGVLGGGWQEGTGSAAGGSEVERGKVNGDGTECPREKKGWPGREARRGGWTGAEKRR